VDRLRVVYAGLVLRLAAGGVHPGALVREHRAGVVLGMHRAHPQLPVLPGESPRRVVIVRVLVDLGAAGGALVQLRHDVLGVAHDRLQLGLDHHCSLAQTARSEPGTHRQRPEVLGVGVVPGDGGALLGGGFPRLLAQLGEVAEVVPALGAHPALAFLARLPIWAMLMAIIETPIIPDIM
jgi:hypothetical protein